MIIFDFTDEEWEAVTLELSERMKNCAYIATEEGIDHFLCKGIKFVYLEELNQ